MIQTQEVHATHFWRVLDVKLSYKGQLFLNWQGIKNTKTTTTDAYRFLKLGDYSSKDLLYACNNV